MAQESLRLVCPPVAAHEGRLPRQYTLEGQGAKKDISPPLEWYGVPDGTRSLALVVQDIDAPEPEAPVVPWTHWVVANISPEIKGLPEGFSGAGGNASADSGVQEGINDWKQPGWRGPVPDSHGHRIQFRIYALDDELSLGNKVTADKVMDAIDGHVLGEAELTAVFMGISPGIKDRNRRPNPKKPGPKPKNPIVRSSVTPLVLEAMMG